MKCVILCAGYATRLYPLTKDMPKALLSIADKPMVEHILDKVDHVDDIQDVFIVTNDRFYDHFQRWLQSYDPKKNVIIVNDKTISNEDRLGALGDIKFVIDHYGLDEELMVIAGDNLFEFSLREFVTYYKEKNNSILALYDMKDKAKLSKKFGVAILGDGDAIVDFEEKPVKPKTSLAATACYLFNPEDVKMLCKYMDVHPAADNPGDFIKHLAGTTGVFGFTFDEGWYDIGSFDQLEEAYQKYENKSISISLEKN